jgi:hypothetical protein
MESVGKLTHWKKLQNPDYLGSYDFQPGEERVVTVKDVKRQMVKGAEGTEEHTILHFVEPYKPMIMNSTNSKMLSKLADSPMVEHWIGKSFKLIVVNIKAFGEKMDALRIKSEKVVKELPELLLGSENFKNCHKAILSGQFTIEQIKTKYKITKEVEEKLNEKI